MNFTMNGNVKDNAIIILEIQNKLDAYLNPPDIRKYR
jgi:hypothetical protein